MSERDRLMAMERCSEYIKDRDELVELLKKDIKNGSFVSQKASALREKLRRKWDIDTNTLHIGPVFSNPDTGIQIGEIQLEIHEREPIEVLTYDVWASLRRDRNAASSGFPTMPYMAIRGDCLFLQLQIDLRRSKKDLLEAFSQKIKEWKKPYTIKKEHAKMALSRVIDRERKPRKTTYDPWEIWDLRHKSNLSLNAIARRKSGKNPPRGERTPAYDEELWAPYKRVQQAYQHAIKMIKTVEKEAHRRVAVLSL